MNSSATSQCPNARPIQSIDADALHTSCVSTFFEGLLALEEGKCSVCVPFGIAAVRVAGKVHYPIRRNFGDDGFILIFAIDSAVAERNPDEKYVQELVQDSVVHRLDEYDQVVFSALCKRNGQKMESIISELTFPIKTVSRGREILGMCFASLKKGEGSPAIIAAVEPGHIEDQSEILYLGLKIISETEYETIKISLPQGNIFDTKLDLLKCNHALIDAQYDILGSSFDTNSRASFLFQWIVDPSSGTRMLPFPNMRTSEISYVILRGSTETDHLEIVESTMKQINLLLKYFNISQGILQVNNEQSSQFEANFDAFMDSFGATRSNSVLSGGAKVRPRSHQTKISDMDFTEALWELLICNSTASSSQVFEALREIAQSLQSGHLRPFIRKDNRTFLGHFCRNVMTGAEKNRTRDPIVHENPALEEWASICRTLETMDNLQTKKLVASKLVELGITCILEQVKANLPYSNPLTSLYDEILRNAFSSKLEESINMLISLIDLLHLCGIAEMINCPQWLSKEISSEYLKHASLDGLMQIGQELCLNLKRRFPVLMIPVRLEPSWFHSNKHLLPNPVFWRLKADIESTAIDYMFFHKDMSCEAASFHEKLRSSCSVNLDEKMLSLKQSESISSEQKVNDIPLNGTEEYIGLKVQIRKGNLGYTTSL